MAQTPGSDPLNQGGDPPELPASRTKAAGRDYRGAVFADKLVVSLALILLICVFTYLILVAIAVTEDDSAARRVGLLVIMVIIVVGFVLWKIPRRQVAFSKDLPPKEAFALENEARKTLAQILGGIFLLVGVYGTLRSMQISEEAQFAGRLDKATEQLSSDKQHVRSGGIIVLKSLSKESPTYKQRAREVLASYVRDIAKCEGCLPGDTEPQANPSPPPGRETAKGRQEAQGLIDYLGGESAMLTGVDLSNTDLTDFTFSGCVCYRWVFFGARLDGARLMSSDLRSAKFERTSLRGANFHNADLSAASFNNADVSNAILDNALLDGTDLSSALNLTITQIEKARHRRTTILPPQLDNELKRKYPATPTPIP